MELSPRRRAYFAYFACLLAGRLLGTNLASFWVGFGSLLDDFEWLWEVWKGFEKEYKIEAEAERDKEGKNRVVGRGRRHGGGLWERKI